MSLEWFCMKIYRDRWLNGFMWQSVYVCIYVINVDDGGLNYTNWFAGYSSRHNISKYFSIVWKNPKPISFKCMVNFVILLYYVHVMEEISRKEHNKYRMLSFSYSWLMVTGGRWWVVKVMIIKENKLKIVDVWRDFL